MDARARTAQIGIFLSYRLTNNYLGSIRLSPIDLRALISMDRARNTLGPVRAKPLSNAKDIGAMDN